MSTMFPKSHHYHDMEKRESEALQVKRGLTERLRRSAIPHHICRDCLMSMRGKKGIFTDNFLVSSQWTIEEWPMEDHRGELSWF